MIFSIKKINWFVFAIALVYLGFFVERTNFILLFGTYILAFGIYFFYLKKNIEQKEKKMLLALGIGIRLLLCFSFPRLSDDIYRFFWDGHLIAEGYNPFTYLPRHFIDNQIFTSDFDKDIFQKLNSPDYFSIYPPVCQIVFFIAYFLSPKNVFGAGIVIKLFLFLCEIGTIFLLTKHENQDKKIIPNASLWYALNPLCIVEICGNLHFEGAMIFFFALVYFFRQMRIETIANNIQSGFFYSLSICSKLLTLQFLSILFFDFLTTLNIFRRPIKIFSQKVILATTTLLFTALFFSPLIDKTFVANFGSSINLYFQKFEYNASIYYIFRQISIFLLGFSNNIIIPKALSIIIISNILYQTFRKATIENKLFWAFFVYLLCQSTVHPWYLTTLIWLSIIANRPLGIIWSGLVFLSYSHYQNGFYKENFYLITLEYTCLLVFFIWQKTLSRRKKNSVYFSLNI